MSPKLLNIFLILATVAIYYMVVVPLYTGKGTLFNPGYGLRELQTKKAEANVAIEQLNTIIQDSEKLKSEYKSITEEDKEMLSVMVPNRSDVVRLNSEFDSMFTDLNIKPDNFSVSNSQTSNPESGEYTISFSVAVTYEEFKRIVDGLDKSKRLLVLSSAGVSASEKIDEPKSFLLTYKSYFVK